MTTSGRCSLPHATRLVLGEDRDAEALGGGPLVRVAGGDGHLGGPVAGDEGRAEPDGAGAEHEHPVVGLDPREPDARGR